MSGSVIPGDRLKTAVYLNLVATPRSFLRKSINGFYRMARIYEVLMEARSLYEEKSSILDLGVPGPVRVTGGALPPEVPQLRAAPAPLP